MKGNVKTLAKLIPLFVVLSTALLLAGCPLEAETRSTDMGGTGTLFGSTSISVELTIFNIPSDVVSFSISSFGNYTRSSATEVGKYKNTNTSWNATAKQNLTITSVQVDTGGATSASNRYIENITFVRGRNSLDFGVFSLGTPPAAQ